MTRDLAAGRSPLVLGLALLGLLASSAVLGKPPAPSRTWQLAQELTVAGKVTSIQVAHDGDTLVARVTRPRGRASTLVYERREASFTLKQELPEATRAASSDWWWDDVALERDTFFSGNTVYARTAGGWVATQELRRASDGTPVQLMGLSGDTIVARQAQPSSPGGVYVFARKGGAWSQVARLMVEKEEYNFAQAYKRSVAISGDTIIVGADWVGGAAYVFGRRKGQWTQAHKLVEQRLGLLASSQSFGFAVAVSGDTALVRSNPNCRLLFWCGGPNLAHVFERRGGAWTQQAKLRAPSRYLDTDLAIDGDHLVVGGPHGVYTAERRGQTWSRLQSLSTRAVGAHDQRYGFLALKGSTLAVAGVAGDAGVIAVFERRPVR